MAQLKARRVAIVLEDGRTVVMHVVLDDGRGLKREATPEWIEGLIAKARLAAKSWRFVDADEAAQLSAALRAPQSAPN